MSRILAISAFLVLVQGANAQQRQPSISGIMLSSHAIPQVVNEQNFGAELNDDSFKHFRIGMELPGGSYAYVWARMWVQAGVVAGQSVGAAVVQAMHESHPNLAPPPNSTIAEYSLPFDYAVDPKSTITTWPIERERVEDFLAVALASNDPASYGFGGLAAPSPWVLTAASSVGSNEADELRAWGKPEVWQPHARLTGVGHVSTLFHDTFHQSLFNLIGNSAHNLQAISALAAFINDNVTAQMSINIAVINPGLRLIDFKIPIRIRRRSLKQIDNPTLFVSTGVPTWFPTALYSAIHVAEAGRTMVVPTKRKASNLMLVWACRSCPTTPYLILQQHEGSNGSLFPSFSIPTTIQADLNGMGLMPSAFLLTQENVPFAPYYEFGGPGGLVTVPMPNMQNSINE